jgi:hypothetical protein
VARVWTCRKCGRKNPRVYANCRGVVLGKDRPWETEPCTGKRPKPRKPKHSRVLDRFSYEQWVERYGELCGICGARPSENRRLDRDHDHHVEGEGWEGARGLLCWKCNDALPNWVTVDWLLNAAKYLDR